MAALDVDKAVEGPSPALGLSVLGLIAFVVGGYLVANVPEANPDVAVTGGLILVGIGLYALVVGAVAAGLRLAKATP